MQPTSMVTMLEARENVFREVTSPGMESPPSPGRPAVSFPCPDISYSRYRLYPTTTGLLERAHPTHNDRVLLYSSVRIQVAGCRLQVLGYGSFPRKRESTAAGALCLQPHPIYRFS